MTTQHEKRFAIYDFDRNQVAYLSEGYVIHESGKTLGRCEKSAVYREGIKSPVGRIEGHQIFNRDGHLLGSVAIEKNELGLDEIRFYDDVLEWRGIMTGDFSGVDPLQIGAVGAASVFLLFEGLGQGQPLEIGAIW